MATLSVLSTASSFMPLNQNAYIPKANYRRMDVSRNMLPIDDLATTLSPASIFLSTIDADIAKISNEDFKTVFTGGIVVMFGGVFSALIVGFLLENGNSYASVVADSYAQGGDEEFWESLSPEDQEKTRELMGKLRKSKEGKKVDGGDDGVKSKIPETSPALAINKEEISMFSDYDD